MQKWALSIWSIGAILTIGSVSIAYAAGKEEPATAIPTIEIETIPYIINETELLLQTENTSSEMEIQDEPAEAEMFPDLICYKEWSTEDIYLLAKIAMAEAEGASIHCKMMVIRTVLNRVESDLFPNSVREVIFQYNETSGVYQFSCVGNGRWDRVEPNPECYEAVSEIRNWANDYSEGALYFESCKEDDNWHSRNLNFLYQSDELRFYR
ncbi:cell wall hydrolase [Parablautia intestinalis]|uniref:cell wall hydrolase n=1 Tax=Parablautia intestinalis TaxID=2320100 RepID=UPI002412DF0C|nr:cell wall hydrolase [Parablautia intestinalis]